MKTSPCLGGGRTFKDWKEECSTGKGSAFGMSVPADLERSLLFQRKRGKARTKGWDRGGIGGEKK